jgi:hypothetical protein
MAENGLLFVISEPSEAMHDELNDWYAHEHLAERLAIEGFLTAFRFVSTTRPRRYLALYDLAGAGVLHTDAYRAHSGARNTPWTKRVTARVRFIRHEATQRHPGRAVSTSAPCQLVVQLEGIAPAQVEEIAARLKERLAGLAGVRQARLFLGTADSVGTMLVLVESISSVRSGLDAVLGEDAAMVTLVEEFTPV